MKTTIDFLSDLKAAYNLTTDGQLHRLLGVSRASISRLQSGKDYFGDENAIKVANLLKIDPAFVLASVHFERAKKDAEKAVWKGIIERLGGLAASVLLVIALFSSLPDFASADSVFLTVGNIHYAKFPIPKFGLFGLILILSLFRVNPHTFPPRKPPRRSIR